MPEQDLYQALGVSRGASSGEIKKAYRKLARELHPDRNPDDTQAEERFKDVSHAYEVLSDDGKRKLYDEFGEVGLKDGFDADAYRQYQAWQHTSGGRRGGSSFEDLFRQAGRGGTAGGGGAFNLEDLFGGGGLEDLLGGRVRGRRAQGPTKGADLEAEIRIGFTDALRGVERELSFGIPGKTDGQRTIRVRIPAGVRDGGKVRLRQQGAPAPRGAGPAGDLVLSVRIDPHPCFRREGDDLHLDLPVSLSEAYGGAKVRIPTLEGDVTLTIPAGTQPGAKLRLRGKGARRGSTTGDLLVHVQPQLPPPGNPHTQESLDELDDSYAPPLRENLKL